MKDNSVELVEIHPVLNKSGEFLHYRLTIYSKGKKVRRIKCKDYLSAFRKSNDLLGFPKIED